MLPLLELRKDMKPLLDLKKVMDYNWTYWRVGRWSNEKQEMLYEHSIERDRKQRNRIAARGVELFKKGIIGLAEKYKKEGRE